MDTALRPTTNGAAGTRTGAAARPAAPATLPQQAAQAHAALASARSAAPLRRGVPGLGSGAQDEVARAQQALEYLEQVASQLESLKGQLASKLSGARGDERALEARVRQLAASLEARPRQGGGGVDANLEFNGGQPATQRFRIRGLDMDSLQANAPQTLNMMIGAAGSTQVSVTIEPGLSRQEVAKRFDRALAPLKVHAQSDSRGQLVFSTDEANWPAVKDSIAVSGRGRVAADEEAPALDPQGLELGNPDALRQSLREVVQALARVRRSQAAASAALSEASARAARATAQVSDAAKMAEQFASTAASPGYDSLLAITSALVGVSRERVLALLGTR
jgi:hypothetical protein